MNKLFDLNNKVAVVTGGNGVLGGAIASGLAKAGVKVGVLGRTKKTVDEKVDSILSMGGEAIPLVADVLNNSELESAYNKIIKKWKVVDILINAAGGNIPGAMINPNQSFQDMDDNAFEDVIKLNLLGTYYPFKIFGKSMLKRKEGVVINISSMAAQRSITRVIGYSAAKAAVDNFTKSMAVEMSLKNGDRIRVNSIAPGFFIGKQNKDLLLNKDGFLTERGKTIIQHTPMRRFGKADELIGTIIWLCSEASSFVTGVVIPVDGGFNAFSGI